MIQPQDMNNAYLFHRANERLKFLYTQNKCHLILPNVCGAKDIDIMFITK